MSNHKMIKDAEGKVFTAARQAEQYKRMAETYQRNHSVLLQEKQYIVVQLQSLFALYNKQKKSLEQLTKEKETAELEAKSLKEHSENLEKTLSRLRIDMGRDADQRRDLLLKHRVLSFLRRVIAII